ncbi:N-acetylmuramoyl-L-alanine amidase family protein [Paraburkholderia dinghuensis]|uniref:N-acetylmuramoyl-L-alanine amidase n=1 Tax=Paraburkholderia dinghuensis TaxID=2305225 RepID=A0A3N6MV66_9BURK|nr:N-acetylmuramoyl-L-alanine amidase [Paraburkholderia dinghuensis]RQH00212.1 cell wall hydrolase [Paraburkholderia dinghuensis]
MQVSLGQYSTAQAVEATTHRPLRIAIDSGHTPEHGGALGARGIYEVQYNDALAQKVCDALRTAGFTPVLTRTSSQDISLDARAQLANAGHADLFLSIHHDSAQLRYLEKFEAGSRDAYRTTKPIRGYSLFVSQLNPHFAQSMRFATLLGDQLRAIGRTPSLHHADPIPGENRELLDRTRGIYRFDDLIVLKKTAIPAVLLEVGVITDPADEAYVSSDANQSQIVEAIVSAVRRYAAASTMESDEGGRPDPQEK